jgi:eukaryotic-like serine/threonine-protein kinase
VIGARLTHYEVIERLGGGGMGEVFKARDLHLHRLVAIKVLSTNKIIDPGSRERFFVEARAASALNHPHIVTIHEIGNQDGTDFLVMEYVAGKTLSEVLQSGPLPLRTLLSYANQLADALTAAHSAGIIHRDLKPPNLMVTPEGRIKVVDFGLAKPESHPVTEDDSTVIEHTAVGVLIGTPAYMSPEQAEGKAVDKRTDIFSFGAVLYEMCTGKPAFSGGSRSSVLAAVLTSEPPHIREICPDIPVELEWIVSRCLRKDPAQRFQDIQDVKITLEEVQAKLASLNNNARPASKPLIRTGHGFWVTASVLTLLAFCCFGLWFWLAGQQQQSSFLVPQQLTFDQGLTITPAISLDGNLIAYASDRAGRGDLDIWVQYRNSGPIQVTHDSADELEPSFSPDGAQIAFRSSKNGGGIYIASALGSGEPRLIAQGSFDYPLFSPDGVSLLALNNAQSVNKFVVMNVEDPQNSVREIAPGYRGSSAAWSPDGKHIAFTGMKDGDSILSLFVVPKSGGPAVKVRISGEGYNWSAKSFAYVDQWLSDDRVLIEASVAGRTQLWIAKLHRRPWSLDRGSPLTVGTSSAALVSASKDGTLVFSNQESETDLWSLPFDAAQLRVTGEARRLTQDSLYEAFPELSANGNLLSFGIEEGQSWKPWVMDLGSGHSRPATERALTGGGKPVISPDGSRVAFTSTSGTYIVSLNDGSLHRIGPQSSVVSAWTADSSALFLGRAGQPHRIALVKAEDGSEIGVLQRKQGVYLMQMSHDGHWLMAFEAGVGVIIAPVTGNTFPAQDQWHTIGLPDADRLRWSPDDNAILFLSKRDSFACIYAQRLEPQTKQASGNPFAVAHFHRAARSLNVPFGAFAAGLAVAKDKIVLAQIESTGNIWSGKLPR